MSERLGEGAMGSKSAPFPNVPLLVDSRSFHTTAEGKVWTRLLIHLCWWLHDMYAMNGNSRDAKFTYIKAKLVEYKALFPAQFDLMFSNPDFSPDEQHPFLICRNDEHKTILLIFRATVSSKCLQDVFTDINILSNNAIYEGDRHRGFASRAESGPKLAVVNWLQEGWRVIVSGNSLGGAVSQLFTADVIDSLTAMGLTADVVVLRCVTFGTPQCADKNFWSKYDAWYNVFDSYIYGNDAIFRLVTFGTERARPYIAAFAKKIASFHIKCISYIIGDPRENETNFSSEQIGNVISDIILPKYYVFGRHHFIARDQQARLNITSIGESQEEKDKLMNDLIHGARNWYKYFETRRLVPQGSLKYIYRDFRDHGCYPFSISQLFNEEAGRVLSKRKAEDPKLLQLPFRDSLPDSVFSLSAFVYQRNENDPYPTYIYLKGGLVDFVRFVTLPAELAESEDLRRQEPVAAEDGSDGRTILCHRSKKSFEFIKQHSKFYIKITTFFSECNVEVLRFLRNPTSQRIKDLDPVSTVLRTFYELVLDANPSDRHGSEPLRESFSTFFAGLKVVDFDEIDKIIARYLAELHISNLRDCANDFGDNRKTVKSLDKIYEYFKSELRFLADQRKERGAAKCQEAKCLFDALSRTLLQYLRKTGRDGMRVIDMLAEENYDGLENKFSRTSSDQMAPSNFGQQQNVQTSHEDDHSDDFLIPLFIDINKLYQYFSALHFEREPNTIRKILRCAMAVYFFIQIGLNRRLIFLMHESLPEALHRFFSSKRPLARDVELKIKAKVQFYGWDRAWNMNWLCETQRTLREFSAMLLMSTGEAVSENESDWEILNRLSGCRWLQNIISNNSAGVIDKLWKETFTHLPLKGVKNVFYIGFIGLMRVCSQLSPMHEILLHKPPKVVLCGESQVGKSTLFKYLTGRDLKELHDAARSNTRMSLQCSALIEFKSQKQDVTIVDNPGQDDATEQGKNLLDMILESASLFIVVTTLEKVNAIHTPELVSRLLSSTPANILILINKIDVKLYEEYLKITGQHSENQRSSTVDWETYNGTNDNLSSTIASNFSACNTIDRLCRSKLKELKGSKKIVCTEFDRRVAIQPIILKDMQRNDPVLSFLTKIREKEQRFLTKTSKENVKKWIIDNLTHL